MLVRDCLWHQCHHEFFFFFFFKVPSNLSDKIQEGATSKEDEEERSGLNNESPENEPQRVFFWKKVKLGEAANTGFIFVSDTPGK